MSTCPAGPFQSVIIGLIRYPPSKSWKVLTSQSPAYAERSRLWQATGSITARFFIFLCCKLESLMKFNRSLSSVWWIMIIHYQRFIHPQSQKFGGVLNCRGRLSLNEACNCVCSICFTERIHYCGYLMFASVSNLMPASANRHWLAVYLNLKAIILLEDVRDKLPVPAG